MSEDLERALRQLGSAKADLAAHASASPLGESSGPPDLAHIACDRMVQRLTAPLAATDGADYWSSMYAERAEAATLIEMLRSDLDAARSEIALLSRRLAEAEAERADLAQALPGAERRGYDLAVSQVYEALRRDPAANAASLILKVSEGEPPAIHAPSPGTEASRELDEELNYLRRRAGRVDNPED